jgi:hypothetical protein
MPESRDTGASHAKVYNRAQCEAFLKKRIDPGGYVRGVEKPVSGFWATAYRPHPTEKDEVWGYPKEIVLARVKGATAPEAWTLLMARLKEAADHGRPTP